ncbi:MAG: hypothetical protein ACP5N2_06320 [Candidatus Nanoarchaeia archaeon]
MGLFSRKKSDEELIKENLEAQQAEIETKDSGNRKSDDGLGDSKIGIEISKIQAQMEGLSEFRKVTNDRFTRNSEELGEIKGMVIETNKSVSKIEAAATRAIDLVEAVKPDQLMIEVRKQDSKAEALKANIESNEMMMRDIMKEIKEMRQRMDFYKGVEQVAKMNDEIKQDLIQIKKVEGVMERHSNKIETIFLEVEKKFTDFDKFGDVAKDLQKSAGKLQEDVDKLRVRIEDKADKKELLNLITRFGEFEKHTTNIINLLDERSKSSSDEIKTKFSKARKEMVDEVSAALKKAKLETTIAERKETEDKITEKNLEDTPVMVPADQLKQDENKKFSIKTLFRK